MIIEMKCSPSPTRTRGTHWRRPAAPCASAEPLGGPAAPSPAGETPAPPAVRVDVVGAEDFVHPLRPSSNDAEAVAEDGAGKEVVVVKEPELAGARSALTGF
jgi:hypothetical protein